MRTTLVVAVVLTLVVMVSCSPHLNMSAPLESDEMIKTINSANTTWKAGRNFGDNFTESYWSNLLGLIEEPGDSELLPLEDEEDDSEEIELPESFDARTKWSYCVSLQQVRDQGACGSCWAVAVAAVLTDRFCIATKGEFNGHLSAEDLMSCCSECGHHGGGCHGGRSPLAWIYIKNTGICTGGDYNSSEGCQPYTVPACEHGWARGPRRSCSSYPKPHQTPPCQQTCYNKHYKYHLKDQDLYFVKSAFRIRPRNVKYIQKQIYKFGPLVANFKVYQDFASHKSGVYHHRWGRHRGRHAVKVIGWGNEDGTDYWLVANSWNSDWGDDKGFFKIRRGTDECGFESRMTGAYPLV